MKTTKIAGGSWTLHEHTTSWPHLEPECTMCGTPLHKDIRHACAKPDSNGPVIILAGPVDQESGVQ